MGNEMDYDPKQIRKSITVPPDEVLKAIEGLHLSDPETYKKLKTLNNDSHVSYLIKLELGTTFITKMETTNF